MDEDDICIAGFVRVVERSPFQGRASSRQTIKSTSTPSQPNNNSNGNPTDCSLSSEQAVESATADPKEYDDNDSSIPSPPKTSKLYQELQRAFLPMIHLQPSSSHLLSDLKCISSSVNVASWRRLDRRTLYLALQMEFLGSHLYSGNNNATNTNTANNNINEKKYQAKR